MKRKFNWAIPGLLAMLLIIAGIALIQSLSAASPDPAKLAAQCSSCHAMDQHVATWKTSVHNDIACTECHADPGVWGWVEMQLGQVRMMLTARRDPNFDLSKVATAVPNERCLNCHARQMPWVMQDLEPPELDENGEPIRPAKADLKHFPALAGHDLHLTLEKPLKCTDCHAGVSHGPAERTEQVQDWHNTCLQCHAEQKVAMTVRTTIACSACHVDLTLVSPDDHKQPDFRTKHGDLAKNDVRTCQQCHLTPGLVRLQPGEEPPAAVHQPVSLPKQHPTIPELPPGSLKVAEGMQDSCSACHGVTMPHPEDWLQEHAKGFKESPALCATCHGSRDQGFDVQILGDPQALPTTDATCTGCHAQPMPHPEGWVEGGHAVQARLAPQTCEQCHSSANPANPAAYHSSPQFCIDCHLNRFAHPPGFIATHAAVALAPNGEISPDCARCHTETTNSCTECHTGGVGPGKTQWHPADWIARHGSVALTSSGSISRNCTTCHTETFNACTECHTGGVGPGKTQWHPEGWIASHGSVALSPDGQISAACTACHTESSFNACTDCHTSGIGVKQRWHPEMFWITHARTTRPEDIADCKRCHNYVEPKCSQCHRQY